ncbi:MAG: DNA repair protein RecO [Armatimonadetes bacterium]|nr:DNA repair protein RecO [Armatimonadota bacterium]
MGLYKIEGIVLRRRSLGEADRLVTVLSRDRGKLTVVAKGARKPRSRLGGRLEPPTRFRALMAEGRTLDVISQVEVLDAHAALRDDLERMGDAAVVLELADRALADRHPHPEVYRLLVDALALLRTGPRALVPLWFAARLLVLTGHRPAVGRCAVCGTRIRAGGAWSAVLGGCVDATCRSRDPQAVGISSWAIALLAFLLDARPAAIRRVDPPASEVAAIAGLLQRYAEVCWETRLRAPAVVGRLREPALRVAEGRGPADPPPVLRQQRT